MSDDSPRRAKNIALLLILAGLALLLFFITILKFGQGGPASG